MSEQINNVTNYINKQVHIRSYINALIEGALYKTKVVKDRVKFIGQTCRVNYYR